MKKHWLEQLFATRNRKVGKPYKPNGKSMLSESPESIFRKTGVPVKRRKKKGDRRKKKEENTRDKKNEEERIKKKVSELRSFLVGLGDLLEEASTDDAAATEDLSDFAVVELPVVDVFSVAHLLEALRVGASLRAVEGVFNRINEGFFVACERFFNALGEELRSSHTLIFHCT